MALNTYRDGASTTYLDNLIQCFTILIISFSLTYKALSLSFLRSCYFSLSLPPSCSDLCPMCNSLFLTNLFKDFKWMNDTKLEVFLITEMLKIKLYVLQLRAESNDCAITYLHSFSYQKACLSSKNQSVALVSISGNQVHHRMFRCEVSGTESAEVFIVCPWVNSLAGTFSNHKTIT